MSAQGSQAHIKAVANNKSKQSSGSAASKPVTLYWPAPSGAGSKWKATITDPYNTPYQSQDFTAGGRHFGGGRRRKTKRRMGKKRRTTCRR